jgi:recombination protein RecA
MESAVAIQDLRLQRACDLQRAACGLWSLAALRGRLTELVGGADSANLSVASRLILQAQMAGDFAAWVTTHRDTFFPPDFAAAGIDLDCLPVVWALSPPEASADTVRVARRAARAAERLLRSGAFGLVVIDLADDLSVDAASQGRLLRLAEANRAQVLMLRRRREDDRYSGSLVGVRAETSCSQIGPGRFRVTVRNTKDKRTGPGWTVSEDLDGPPGLY